MRNEIAYLDQRDEEGNGEANTLALTTKQANNNVNSSAKKLKINKSRLKELNIEELKHDSA